MLELQQPKRKEKLQPPSGKLCRASCTCPVAPTKWHILRARLAACPPGTPKPMGKEVTMGALTALLPKFLRNDKKVAGTRFWGPSCPPSWETFPLRAV